MRGSVDRDFCWLVTDGDSRDQFTSCGVDDGDCVVALVCGDKCDAGFGVDGNTPGSHADSEWCDGVADSIEDRYFVIGLMDGVCGSRCGIDCHISCAGTRRPNPAGEDRLDLTTSCLIRGDTRRLRFANVNLVGANLSYSILRDTNLNGALLFGTNMHEAWIGGANLTESAVLGSHPSKPHQSSDGRRRGRQGRKDDPSKHDRRARPRRHQLRRHDNLARRLHAAATVIQGMPVVRAVTEITCGRSVYRTPTTCAGGRRGRVVVRLAACLVLVVVMKAPLGCDGRMQGGSAVQTAGSVVSGTHLISVITGCHLCALPHCQRSPPCLLAVDTGRLGLGV